MQPSRNQCVNGTMNLNFDLKFCMSNPWQVYFLLTEQKDEKVMAYGWRLSRLAILVNFKANHSRNLSPHNTLCRSKTI